MADAAEGGAAAASVPRQAPCCLLPDPFNDSMFLTYLLAYLLHYFNQSINVTSSYVTSLLLLLLLLLHGPGRNLEHPFGEPNAAHGVITS
jgi:hypothetical protein